MKTTISKKEIREIERLDKLVDEAARAKRAYIVSVVTKRRPCEPGDIVETESGRRAIVVGTDLMWGIHPTPTIKACVRFLSGRKILMTRQWIPVSKITKVIERRSPATLARL